MKACVSSYSFRKCMMEGMPIADVIRKSKEIGYEQIEFTTLEPPEGVGIKDYAAKLREYCAEAGIEVASYDVSADFINGSGGDPALEAERVKGCVDITEILGAKMMRHDVTYGYKNQKDLGYIQAVNTLAAYVREVTKYAEAKGIQTMTENHGTFLQDSYRMEYLLNKVGHPNYGLLIDIGNFLCADEEPMSAVSRLAPYVAHAHLKDFLFKSGAGCLPGERWITTRGGNFIRGTILGHGVVPIAQCVRILRNSGYDGGLSLEFEGLEDNIFAVEAGYKFIKSVI